MNGYNSRIYELHDVPGGLCTAWQRNLGYCLSCCRDEAFIAGFNPSITLTRTQTIMEGAPVCDFRFMLLA